MIKIALVLLLLLYFGVVNEAHAIKSCQCIAFRMDDIQDYWLDDVQVGVINEFQHKNASLTIGIIGNYFGHDEKIVNNVSDILKHGNTKLAIANHGWNHEHFNTFSRDEQSALIHSSNQKISDILGILPNIFIAPYDAINNDTVISLFNNNMTYLSTNETQDTPPYHLSNVAFFRFPGTAEIGDLNKKNTEWISLGHNQTYAEVLRSMVKYGFAVVVLHPQDYANKLPALAYDNVINKTQIHELGLLIDQMRNDGYSIVTIDEIPKYANYDTTYPKWLESDLHWFYNEDITSNELINLVDFLKNDKKIMIDHALAKYPLHQNITATYFWIGEAPDVDNQYIDNISSAWDDNWVNHYGGVDDPTNRNQYFPSSFIPKENPFYFALPYNDFYDNGTRRSDAYNSVYWSSQKTWDDSESMLKNRWIMITKSDKIVYAQWEDAGPFVYDDSSYVFGDVIPKNQLNNNAGLDVSPAVNDYLDLQHGKNVVSWKFVDYDQVPDGPWKQIVTSSGVSHSPN